MFQKISPIYFPPSQNEKITINNATLMVDPSNHQTQDQTSWLPTLFIQIDVKGLTPMRRSISKLELKNLKSHPERFYFDPDSQAFEEKSKKPLSLIHRLQRFLRR